jgi:hypothetical protein
MWEALKICLPITLMTFAIFTRSNMVVTTGWLQFSDTVLVMIGTCGFAFAMFGRFLISRPGDIGLRLLTGALSLFVLFYPNDNWAMAAAPFAAIATIIGIWRHRLIAPPAALDGNSEVADASGDLSALVAEAKRDMG